MRERKRNVFRRAYILCFVLLNVYSYIVFNFHEIYLSLECVGPKKIAITKGQSLFILLNIWLVRVTIENDWVDQLNINSDTLSVYHCYSFDFQNSEHFLQKETLEQYCIWLFY